ncbi:outer membrane protein transport protein [Gallaecimonas kandeliae]|uniref:OmpP1/FadL family transporter n=1 Tax=Gallaecimonas kandeliae TaxID=3029055 RepID=UPI002649DA1E|nr:outer membrane protein transport protein [Gallaecimonas kandeliae]WKE64187.1 outer membrane protein transport protein [Gallaecimonas kandeliae]
MQLLKKSLLASAIFSICSGAMAAGFQVTEHSAKGLGRSNAGDAAIAEDASVVSANPALMTKLTKPTLTVLGAYIMPDINVEGTSTNYFTTGGTPIYSKEHDVAPNAFVPAMYFVMPINEQWTFGIGGFSDYGLKTDYSAEAMTAPLADKTDLKIATLNPSLAYKVDDSLSIGIGFDIAYADATINSSMPANIQNSQFAPFAGKKITEMTGNDYGYGWNLGLTYNFSPDTTIGLSYRSKIDFKLDGHVNTGILPSLGSALLQQDPNNQTAKFLASLPASFNDTVNLTTPDIWQLALDQKLPNGLSLQASVFHLGWSNFDKLVANSQRGAMLLNQPENWNDTWAYALGLTYQMTSDLTLRAGIKYDESPTDTQNRTLRIPDNSRTWYSLGLSYKFNDNFDVDFGWAYLSINSVTVHEGEFIENGAPSLTGQFDGTGDGTANIVGLQANYRF